jgi:hypothetical protein
MARKVSASFKATITKNQVKSGAWLVEYEYQVETTTNPVSEIQAWSNASAGKRWIKEKVQTLTPRKSLKMIVVSTDLNGKPTKIVGEMTFKVEA